MNNQQGYQPQQGQPQQGQQQQYNQQGQQQSKQPIDKGLVQIAVGTYQSKTKFEQDGRTPKQETDFLPMGKWTEWEKHITVDVVIDGKKMSLMLFKTPPQNNNQQGY